MRRGRPFEGHSGERSRRAGVSPSHRAPTRRRRFAARPRQLAVRALVALLLVVAMLPLVSLSLDPQSADAKTPASVGTTFEAGSYIIDMGAFTTIKPTGLQPYGILYKLLTVSHTPVAWIIKDGKPGGNPAPGTGLPALTAQASDFSASVVPDGAGTAATTPVATKSYQLGAFVIPKAFITPQVDSFIAAFPNVIVDKAVSSFTAPMFELLEYWPKAVLDAQNGAIAQGFYTNAGVPASTSSYIWKSPSQLNSCDDIYVMPHADPTWATHRYLKPFNNQGGYIWAGCHAVSVLENLFDPAAPTDRMNFLTTDGLVPFGNHNGGTPPYSYNTDGSDPVMQFGVPIDAATQNGSEQIYLPKLGSAWRPSAIDVTWDATQADVPLKSPGDARVLTYGRGFGIPTNGRVMYEGSHSINKGTIGDVAAQRAFFNFLLLGGIDRAPSADVSIATPTVLSGGTTTMTAQVTGGSPGYNYQWTSTCGGTFSPASGFSGSGSISTTYTAPAVSSEQTCVVNVLITDQCGRTPFGAATVQVVPSADLAISKTVDKATVSVDGTLTYTLTVRNHGTGTALAPTVTDVLPPDTEYISATPVPGSISGRTLTWTLPNLAVDATSTITITAKALTPGALLTNTASVSSTTADPDMSNNTATAVSRVLNSGISIEKIARPLIVGPGGGTVTFEFVVRNTGTDPLTDVVVTDNPACTTMTGPTGDLNGDGVLAPKFSGVETEIWRYTCTRDVTTSTGDVAQSASGWTSPSIPPLDGSNFTKQDVVQVTAKDPLGNPLHEVASTVVTISNPSIAVTKVLAPANQAPAPGDKATFTVTVSNTGNVPLVAVDTTDVWAGTCDTATLPTLAVGASFAMTCDATVPAAGSASDGFGSGAPSYSTGTGWAGAWTESGGGGPADGGIQVVDGTAVRVPSAAAGWPLPTGYSPTNVLAYAGNKITLTRRVDLAGKTSALLSFSYFRTAPFNKDDRPLTVRVSPDNGATWTTGTITSTRIEADDSGWSTFQMTVTGAFTANTLVQLGATGVDLSNRTIYVDDVRLVSNQVNSVTATAKDEYGNPVTATATAPVQPGFPSLAITKSAVPSWLRLGSTFDYTVTVTNTGTTFQSGINVTDDLPSGLTRTGSVTVSRPTYWDTLASDGFGTGQAYSTGTGWATDWTETNEATSPTAGKIQVSTTVGSPASSLWINNPGSNATTPYLTRDVNLSGRSSAQLQLQCLRNSAGDSTDDILGVYVEGILVLEVNRNTSAAVCPTSGTTFGPAITVQVPAAALVSGASVTIKATGNKQYWVDNVAILVPGSTSTVTAGNPPNLTSTGGNNGSATNFGLAPGASMTFTIPVRVDAPPADGLQFSNTARTTSDQQTSPVSASVTTPFLAPDFAITKTAIETWVNGTPGNVKYRIELTNTGNVALTDVVVADPSCNAAPTYVFGDLNTDQRLQLGEVWRYECTRTITATDAPAALPGPDVVPNTASATMTDAISGGAVDPKQASAEVRVIHPAVMITPTPSTAVIQPGEMVAYTYTVTNTGDIGVTDVTPTAANCEPLVYQSGDANGDAILNVTETWTYACTTDAISANQLDQDVSVTAKDRIFASEVTDVDSVDVYVTPPLVLTKTAYDATSDEEGDAITVGANNAITYRYTVESPSATPAVGVPLTDVQVTDDKCSPVAAELTGDAIEGDLDSDDELDPGEIWTFTCNLDGPLAETTTNHAYATGTYTLGGGGTVPSNQDEATVTVATPHLTLGKESSSETVRAGHDVTYLFTVANTGATSFDLSSLGAPSDSVVDPDGTITSTTACSSISAPSFPHDDDHDANGNGVLNPGEMLFYTCTSTLTVDTRDAFQLGESTDLLGTAYTPDPALAMVFVIDPTFSVVKLAETSLGGPATEVPGIPGEPVTYTFRVTHTTPVRNDFHDGLESLTISLEDPRCDGPPTFVDGDTGNNGLLDPGEVWDYTCTLSALPNGEPTVNTVTVTASVNVRDLEPDGSPSNPDDGLGDIVHTAQATTTPSTKQITVTKQGLNCDVNQPVCANNFPGTAFMVYSSDPTVGSPTGTPLTNSPAGSATFVSGDLVINNDYWLVETATPEGFQLLAQPIRFTLGSTDLTLDPASASSLITSSSLTITVTDVPAVELPKTGGRGFLPYLGAGLLLIVGASLAYARTWRSAPKTRGRGD